MARKQVDRQLRLFGVGDLGDLEDGANSDPDVESGADVWTPIMRTLGLILRDGHFEAHLAKSIPSSADDSR